MQPNQQLEQLKLLFDYTKFHIGLYTTVGTIFGGLIAASDKIQIKFHPQWLFASVICICIAGAAGGTIASSIPGYGGYDDFWKSRIAPFLPAGTGLSPAFWAFLEHAAFWLAMALALNSIRLGH
jgi:hypothetical protein